MRHNPSLILEKQSNNFYFHNDEQNKIAILTFENERMKDILKAYSKFLI